MKEISEYTLKECLEEIEMLHGGYGYRDPEKLADRIHELTRWIPVSERMPTEEDGDRHGQILIFEVENESPNRGYQQLVKWDAIGEPDYFYAVTHWQRITPPEGV